MYKIYCDGEIIHDPSLDSPERLVYGATLTQQANMADRFSFTIYPNNPGAANIYKLVSTIEVYQDNELLFRGRPIQSTTGWDNQQTITCEGGLALFNDTILRPYSYTGTVRGYLQMLVTQHNEQVPADKRFLLRTVTVTDPNNNIVRSNSDYVITMQEIQDKLVNNLGGYLVVTYNNGWVLDYLAVSTEATGQTITLAKNLLDIIREQNAENIATGLIPLGATDEQTGQRITIESVNGGKDYIIDQTAASQYGLIFATEIWDDVTVPANLLTKARAKLTDYATLIPTIQLTAVDLSLTDQSIDPIRLLDNITVEDDQHHASGNYLVTQRTYNLSDPSSDAVTFGGKLPTITGVAARTSTELQEVPQRILKNASDRARAILDDATDGAIQILYNNDGVAYELRINNTQDPNAATSYWRYNAGGWGYYDAATDTYKTAATMDGAILATLITAGILQSDDGQTFYLDLDNGVLKGNFSELKISGAAGATQAYANNKAAAEASAAQAAAISAAASDATSKITAYDNSLNQTVVFNKLTNNGAEQGIYLQNGKVYINGEYIKANTIGADSIIGDSITIAKLAPAAKDVLITGTTVKNQYYLSTSSSSATGGSWSDTTPTWSSGKYVWTRVSTTKTYADGDSTTTTSTAVYDKTLTDALSTAASASSAASSASSAASAAQSTANGNIVSTVSCYYRSTSSTTPTINMSTSIGTSATTDNAWEYVMPRPKKNTYMFTCERYTKADGSVSFSTVRQMSMLTYASMWCSANDATAIDGGAIYTGSVTADKIDVNDLFAQNITATNMNITGGGMNVNGTTTTDGKISVKFTTQGRTYQSILKPAMLVNSYDYSGSHEEADVRYDRLQFVSGSTDLSSYEDVACTIKSTNGSYVTILPPSASGKYITLQPSIVSTW